MKDKVLLIAPGYFNYHSLIIDSLERNGYTVDFCEEEIFISPLTILSKSYLKRKKVNYQKSLLNKLNEKEFDYLIVIGGRSLDKLFLESLLKKETLIKILYQWDSISNFDYRLLIPYFDKVKTFDSQDARDFNLQYLPLFYKNNTSKIVEEDIDLLFVGIWHSDRLDVLKEIASFAEGQNLNFYFKVYYPWYMYYYLVYIRKKIKRSSFFTFKKIPSDEMNQYYQRAKCIVDINHPGQTGLTMRTIETLGNGKRLITTNGNITNESFYNANMIHIIDRINAQIPAYFLSAPKSKINIEELEIENWIKKLLDQ